MWPPRSVRRPSPAKRGARVARKPNYGFEKRQKELAKQRKKEEKALKKAERASQHDAEGSTDDETPAEGTE